MSSRYDFFYLIEIRYLGFRYHGWQYQPGLKTLQGVLERTFNFIFQDKQFKILGAGRTDAMVSAECACFELFTKHELTADALKDELNYNLPADIEVLNITIKDKSFNIIKDVSLKTYHYYFAAVDKKYPFAAPFMNCILYPLDLEKMKEGARRFEGEHDFKFFMTGDHENKDTKRKIFECIIEENQDLKANFFPPKSYCFKVKGKGFMRYQIRLMMGALIQLGKNETTLEEIEKSLQGIEPTFYKLNAAASGLMVKNIEFKN